MMTSNNKKMLIFSSIIALSIILLLVFMLLGLNLGIFKINSISYLLSQYDLIKKSEKELTTTQSLYDTSLVNLQNEQTEYNKQKSKYEAISDETVNVIKEATTEETYNIEYMWIKLGNYAKKNNLEIVMVEPGGSQGSSNSNASSTTTASTNTNSSKTSTATTTSNNTTAASTSTNSNNTNSSNTTTNNSSTSSSSSSSSTDNSNFKVQVKGSYMNTSDFIFEVENDTALKFKLDNISMDYVEGTTIKTSFNVKNLKVNK